MQMRKKAYHPKQKNNKTTSILSSLQFFSNVSFFRFSSECKVLQEDLLFVCVYTSVVDFPMPVGFTRFFTLEHMLDNNQTEWRALDVSQLHPRHASSATIYRSIDQANSASVCRSLRITPERK